MPSDPNAPRLPNDALDLFLDGVLAELRDPADSSALDEVRAAFRRRIPFHMRSYAAAVLILRAAGVSRGPSKQPSKESAGRASGERLRKQEPAPAAARREKKTEKPKARPEQGQSQNRADSSSRPRYRGEGTTVFFSMGKRQRLHPRALIDLLVDVAGVALEDIGEVRTFDNYSFADLNPDKAQQVVTGLNGVELRGRKLSVNLAKKRDETVE